MTENDILLIPDVHGRTFWKEVVKGNEDKRIIFLGDYLDPYPDEGITFETALDNFNDIIGFKKAHKDNVILLLGNHDLHYIYKGLDGSRKNRHKQDEIKRVFEDNFDLFEMCKQIGVGDKNFIFSHAGIHKKWIDKHFNDLEKYTTVEDFINDKWKNNSTFINALADVSWYRGGFGEVGSMIWSDVRESLSKDALIEGYHQIFGHTQAIAVIDYLETLHFACIDCHKAFVLTEEGKLEEYGN